MADVQPFRALRYAQPSEDVVAPPYDVVSSTERESLLGRDPHNVGHLTLVEDADEAGRTFRAWIDDGALVRDDAPAVWVWEQEFTGLAGARLTRSGIAASLRAEPYERRVVIPHERTHAGPIESRLRLLRAVRTQLEPLFFLYEGQPPVGSPARAPDLAAGGTRLWRVEDDGAVTDFFAGRQVLIADGHHRYETSLAFAPDTRVLAVLVATDDPGLEVLATHRVFSGRRDIDVAGEPCGSLDEARARLAEEPAGRAAAVFYRGGAASLVRGEPGQLDVELVDRFGLDGISYTVDAGEAARLVDDADADCAFFVRTTPIDAVFERSRQGTVMPPKATHFFPKLLSGLLFLPLDDA
jgi:uncharacterized protein (DUF1015 family)